MGGLRGSQKGVTLVELMVVVAMIGILVGVLTPNILSSLPVYRTRAAARHLLFDLQKAKLEAVKRGKKVVVEFFPEPYADAGERGRYLICVDLDDPANNACDATDTVLADKRMPKNVSLYSDPPGGITFAGNKTGFDYRGFPSTTGSVRLRNNKGRELQVTISSVGRISIQ